MSDSSKENKEDLNKLYNIAGLTEVEEFINKSFVSDAPLLQEIPQYLHSLGGKRIRPILTLLVAKACGETEITKDLLYIASGIEMIHMATILHDDIIDNSNLRRNKVSANIKFGINNTLLAGDFLLVRAFGLCGHLSDSIVTETEKACVALTEGEILETPLFQDHHNLDSYINIAKKKTASLFALAGFCGSQIAGCDIKTSEHFKNFGENLGVSFQILDDILDVTSSEEKLGKPIGTDLREKKPSIINILWLNTNSDLARLLLDKNSPLTSEILIEMISEINSSDFIIQAKKLAKNYALKAKEELNIALEQVKDSNLEYINLLELLIDYTISRSS